MKTQLVKTPYGQICVYEKDDCISATIKSGVFWDGPLLLPFYDKYAKKGETAIDIGSFCGISAVYLAQTCKAVIAVEPIHHHLVDATLAANGLTNRQVVLLRGAAYDEACWFLPAPDEWQGQKVAGVAPDEIDNPGGVALHRATTLEAQQVECIQGVVLDKWIEEGEKVCLIKSDAQGCDLRALKGLSKTIARDRPAILFEFEERLAELHGDSWATYEAFFRAMDYELEEQGACGYVNNFIGLPR